MTRNAVLILPTTKVSGAKPTTTWGDGEAEREKVVRAVKLVLDDTVQSLKDRGIVVKPKKEANPKDLDYLHKRIKEDGLGILQDPQILSKLIEITIIDPFSLPIIDRYNLIKSVYDLINQALADS